MSCGCNENKPIKEALVITKDNLRSQAHNAIYNVPIAYAPQDKYGGGRTTASYQKLVKSAPKKHKPVTDSDKDKMVKELIPFLAYLYKKHLKAIVQENVTKTPTFVEFIRENIKLKNGKLLLKKKG
jgi:hypothetical protein